jgi:glycosyltransferase involved in cell wall biosynthesis
MGVAVVEINLSPYGLDRSWHVRVRRIARVWRGVLRFLRSGPRRNDTLYMSVSGGFGQLYELLFAVLAQIFQLRIVLHHHSYAYLEQASRLTRWLMRTAGPKTLHVVLTAGMANRLRAAYPICTRTVVISNAAFLDSPATATVRRRNSLGVIGFLGNISEAKGVLDFLQVASRLESERHSIIAKLAGPFDDRAIESRVRQCLRSRRSVDYVGPKYGEAKAAFLDGIDVLVFPTRYQNEAEPLAILEAMAHGIPVIAYDRGSIAEVLTPACGMVVGRSRNFVEAAVEQLKAWDASPAILQAASRAARAQFDTIFERSCREWNMLRIELCSEVGLCLSESARK